MRVQALDWNSPEDVSDAGGPFQYVLAADCVYHEEHVEPLYRVVLALADLRSTGPQPWAFTMLHIIAREIKCA